MFIHWFVAQTCTSLTHGIWCLVSIWFALICRERNGIGNGYVTKLLIAVVGYIEREGDALGGIFALMHNDVYLRIYKAENGLVAVVGRFRGRAFEGVGDDRIGNDRLITHCKYVGKCINFARCKGKVFDHCRRLYLFVNELQLLDGNAAFVLDGVGKGNVLTGFCVGAACLAGYGDYVFGSLACLESKAVQKKYGATKTMIDIGGEDAKIVFYKNGNADDLRMNGNCAGGTGAFIDQMAIILGVTTDELNRLALCATHIYPIASRCGVFCKTDIQNLIAKNVSRENIAASIFHAVAVQTITTLAHGYDITTPILFCGGPLTFIPALRKAFKKHLLLSEEDIILPQNGELITALGTAMVKILDEKSEPLGNLIKRIKQTTAGEVKMSSALQPLFGSDEAYNKWAKRIADNRIARAELTQGEQEAYIGISVLLWEISTAVWK